MILNHLNANTGCAVLTLFSLCTHMQRVNEDALLFSSAQSSLSRLLTWFLQTDL